MQNPILPSLRRAHELVGLGRCLFLGLGSNAKVVRTVGRVCLAISNMHIFAEGLAVSPMGAGLPMIPIIS